MCKLYFLLLFVVASSLAAPVRNIYQNGERLKLLFYIGDDIKSVFQNIWTQDIIYSDYTKTKEITIQTQFDTTLPMQQNGTIWGIAVICPASVTSNALYQLVQNPTCLSYQRQINEYQLRSVVQGGRNLLFDKPSEKVEHKAEVISVLNQKVGVYLVEDFKLYTDFRTAEPLLKSYYLRQSGETYKPPLLVSTIETHQVRIPVNESVASLPIEITFTLASPTKWVRIFQLEHSSKMFQSKDIEMVKRLMTDSSIWVLYLVIAIAFSHFVFMFLRYKNDLSFWRSRTSFEGLSVQAIKFEVVSHFVILLYLWDNDTSLFVLFTIALGLVVEFYKLTKVVVFEVNSVFPFFHMYDRDAYKRSQTLQYDEMAMRYVGTFLWPVVIAYCLYSLVYDTHLSWYSWFISSMATLIYALGFIRLTPQLFINYKLKSVAHMPWRAFVYKIMNTFVDDIVAFLLDMPSLHRLSCFRDDIVFFIFLYQLWIYPSDKTRAHEYGEATEQKKSQ